VGILWRIWIRGMHITGIDRQADAKNPDAQERLL
jgi:hypothetical protein